MHGVVYRVHPTHVMASCGGLMVQLPPNDACSLGTRVRIDARTAESKRAKRTTSRRASHA
jgi:hypothetical protein